MKADIDTELADLDTELAAIWAEAVAPEPAPFVEPAKAKYTSYRYHDGWRMWKGAPETYVGHYPIFYGRLGNSRHLQRGTSFKDLVHRINFEKAYAAQSKYFLELSDTNRDQYYVERDESSRLMKDDFKKWELDLIARYT